MSNLGRTTLPILHFNDVYKMTQLKSGARETARALNEEGEYPADVSFDQVIQFTSKLEGIRDSWVEINGTPQGLVLFSGDLFSHSPESILTQGQNMVHIMNELAPDACVPGNHEFDFGLAQFTQLVKSSNFKWILSNVRLPGKLLPGVVEHWVVERANLKIGIIGVMSHDAYNGVNWEGNNIQRQEMYPHCLELSKSLREHHGCDIVIAITHAKHHEDIKLAHRLYAYPKAGSHDPTNRPGVDVVLGGHNHAFFCGKGVTRLDSDTEDEDGAGSEAGDLDLATEREDLGYEPAENIDAKKKEDICGNPNGLLLVKSGEDFRDLSEIELELEPTSGEAHRKMVVTSLKLRRHKIKPDAQKDAPRMRRVLQRIYDNDVDMTIDQPIAFLEQSYDITGDGKKEETAIGNWIADSILAQEDPNYTRVHGLIMTAGSIQKMTLSAGQIKKRHIFHMVPYDNVHKIIEIPGQKVYDMLESALDKAPEKSPKFPIISRLTVEYSHETPTNEIKRVKRVFYKNIRGEKIQLQRGQTYKIMTNTFLTSEKGPFSEFKGRWGPWEGLPISGVLLQYLDPDLERKKERGLIDSEKLRAKIQTMENSEVKTQWQNLSEAFDKMVGRWSSHEFHTSGLMKIDLSGVDGRITVVSA